VTFVTEPKRPEQGRPNDYQTRQDDDEARKKILCASGPKKAFLHAGEFRDRHRVFLKGKRAATFFSDRFFFPFHFSPRPPGRRSSIRVNAKNSHE